MTLSEKYSELPQFGHFVSSGTNLEMVAATLSDHVPHCNHHCENLLPGTQSEEPKRLVRLRERLPPLPAPADITSMCR